MENFSLTDGLVLYLILLVSLSVHEWAHAWSAMKLGDRTAYSQGRVSLNPIVHMDPIGTVLLPMLFIFLSPGFIIFGWGKPVPVDTRNLGKPVRDDILISMAGPFSNLLLCLLAGAVFGLAYRFGDPSAFIDLFRNFLLINAILLVFNLIPIPPLDGSHVLRHIVGMSEETYYNIARFGFVALIVLINIPVFQSLLRAGVTVVSRMSLSVVSVFAG